MKHFADIRLFVERAKGLSAQIVGASRLRIEQHVDGKFISVDVLSLDDVLFRSDNEGAEFIQVNFVDGSKILLTDTLIGFKPFTPKGLDSSRLPRVVTTPDVINVFEAIQESLHSSGPNSHELSILKKVFEAVLCGGESIGFDLSLERSWMARIPAAVTNIPS